MPIRSALFAKVSVLSLFGALIAPSIASAADRTQSLIDAVTRANGGVAAAQAIPALRYDLHIKEATFEVDATYVVDRKSRMRIDIYADGKRVFTECHDGSKAWQMDAKGVASAASEKGTAALWHGTQYPGQIFELAELPKHGHSVKSIGRETIDGTAYDALELTMSDGFRTWRYVDPRSHLITRGRDRHPLHVDIDPTEKLTETVWSDFRKVDGVQRPFVSAQAEVNSGNWQQTATVKSIRRLAALPDSLFVFGSAPQTLR